MFAVETLFDVSRTAVIYCDTTMRVKAVCADCCRLSGSPDTRARTRPVLLFQSHVQGFEDMMELQFFSVYEASGDVRRLIKVTKMLHKPDVFKESCSLNFVGGCLFLWFFKYACVLSSHEILWSFMSYWMGKKKTI